MTLALAIGGWTFAVFLMVKLWIEMDMRIQLEEALAEEAANNDKRYQLTPEDISILNSRGSHAMMINLMDQNNKMRSEWLREKFERECV